MATETIRTGVVKCETTEAVYTFISEHEERYRVKFITAHKDKEFGKPVHPVPDPGKHFLRWRLDYGGQSPKIDCDGVPFFYMHRHVLICHQGKDRNVAAKAKRKVAQASSKDEVPQKKRKLVQDTKKVDCPASVYVVQILRFTNHSTEFSGLEPTGHSKVLSKRKLREEYKSDASSIQTETVFYINLPPLSAHIGHPVNNIAAGLREALDPRLYHKIVELTSKGVCKVQEVRRHLDEYVRSELFHSSEKPERTRRRYYPTEGDIINAVQRAKREVPTKVDQKNMAMLISLWKQDERDYFEYRPLKQGSDSDKFLLCCQTHWQRKLLNKYGGSVTLLDAIYRSAGYPLPLFLLSVRTNMGYVVVGVFVSHSDTAEDIAEALKTFRRWNPEWAPQTFMVDYFDHEIEATESVFPGCTAVLSYYRCEKLWREWLDQSSEVHDQAIRTRILTTMHRIAMATNYKDQESAIKGLKMMPVWRDNELVSNWFTTFWFSCTKRWTRASQTSPVQISLYAVNGLKQQAELQKQEYIRDYKDCSLSEMMTVLFTKLFPAEYKKYVEFNARYSSGYLKYSSDVPNFLHSRPRFIIERVVKNMASTIKPEHVQDCQNGCFTVRGEKSQVHRVYFGSETEYPSCTCSVWSRLLLPCKHFCAIFTHEALNWSWDQLCPAYRDNPLFHLDKDVLVNDNQEVSQATGSLETEGEGKGEENVEIIYSSQESKDTPSTQEAKGSIRPQRKAVKRKHLVQKNMDILDKMQSQVPKVKDQQVLEEMLDQLQMLLQKIQGRNKRTMLGSNRVRSNSRHAGQKKRLISAGDSQIEPQTSNQFSEATSENSQGQFFEGVCSSKEYGISSHSFQQVEHPNDNEKPAEESQSSQISTPQDKEKVGTTSTSYTLSHGSEPSVQQCISSLNPHDNHQITVPPVFRQSKEVEASQEIPSDTIEAVVVKPDQYSYIPINVSGDYPQGLPIQGTIVEHHDLHGNITFVTEDPSLIHQDVLSTIIQTVGQGHQDNYIIESAHPLQGVTVTVADSIPGEDVPDDVT